MRLEGGTSVATVNVASDAAPRRHDAARHARSRDAANDITEARHEDGLLPRHLFLRDLHREKTRADRSSSPLSLVVFDWRANDHSGAVTDIGDLLDVLHARTRETDIIGHFDHERIAVLCPDTDADGARELSRKIEATLGAASCASEHATYPGALFDDLSKGSRVVPLTQAFVRSDLVTGYRSKRIFDVVGALSMLMVLWPLMTIVAIAIALTSRGPIIFKQKRLGRGGSAFTFYKFRSMVAHGDDQIHRNYIANFIRRDAKATTAEPGSTPYKLRSDPRITPIGRLIRKTSIDELPQLFNVLRGDMSLVGPRPPIPYETNHYHAWHMRRITSMKPGLTGLWQVEGRGRVTFNEMVRLDLRYIRDCSLWLDVKILARTVGVVFKGLGAA